MKKIMLSFLTTSMVLSSNVFAQYNPTTSDTNRRKLDLRWRGGDIIMSKDTVSLTTIRGSSQVDGEGSSTIIGAKAHYEAMWTTHDGYGFAFSPNITISIQGKQYKVMELNRVEIKGNLVTLFTAQKIVSNDAQERAYSRIYYIEETQIPQLKSSISEIDGEIKSIEESIKNINIAIVKAEEKIEELKKDLITNANYYENHEHRAISVKQSIQDFKQHILNFKEEIKNHNESINKRTVDRKSFENEINNLNKEIENLRSNLPTNRIWGTADIALGEIGGVMQDLNDIKYFKAGGTGTIVKGSFHVAGEINEKFKLELSATGKIGEVEVAYRRKNGIAPTVKEQRRDGVVEYSTVASFGGSFEATAGVGLGPVRILNHFFANGAFTHQDYKVGNTTSINVLLKAKKASVEIGVGQTFSRECAFGTCVDQSYTGLNATVRH